MLVKKGKNTYLYQSIREEGEIRTKYQGKLTPQQIQEHQHSKEEQTLRKHSHRDIAALLDDLDEIRVVHDLILRAGLLVNDHYLRRSEIRRMHNAD